MGVPTRRSSVKCISFQLSRIRFLTARDCHLENAAVVTGSWMEEMNRVSLWRYNCSDLIAKRRLKPTSEAEDGTSAGVLGDSADDPCLVSSAFHPGWVQDLKVHSATRRILTASSLGSLHLFVSTASHMYGAPDDIERVSSSEWKPFHEDHFSRSGFHGPSALSSISFSLDGSHAFVGEDAGFLGLVDLSRAPKHGAPLGQKSESLLELRMADTVNAMELVDTSSLATVHQTGRLMVYDVRSGLKNPQQRLLRPGPCYPLHCVARHPGQSHILAVGGVGDGGSSAAYIWDTRATQYPLTEVACEGRSVWEIAFHPQDPRHLYLATQKAGLLQISCRGDTDSWSGFKGSRRKLVVGQATPPLHDMISFDLAGQYLVCAHSNTTIQTVVSDAYAQH